MNQYLQVKIQAPKKKSKAGIILPEDHTQKIRIEVGEVVEVHKDSKITKGTIIYFKNYSLETISVDGTNLHFVREDDVLGTDEI